MKSFLIAIPLLLAVGCASSPSNKTESIVNIDSKIKVYARISKAESGEYYFSDFSFIESDDSIELNTLSNNYDKREILCRIGLGAGDSNIKNNVVKICESEDDIEFRYSTIDGRAVFTNTFGNVLAAAMSMGTATSAYFSSKFDFDEFDKALKSALAKQPREKLISDFNEIHAKYTNELQVKSQDLELKKKTLESMLKGSIVLKDKTNMLKATPQVRVNIINAINSDLGVFNNWKSNDELIEQIKKKTSEKYSAVKLAAHCNELSNYEYTITGCQQSWGFNDPITANPVIYNIEKVKKYKYYPVVNASNANVIVKSTQSGIVELSNLTDSFLTIDSFSLYVGGKIETLSNLGITLPPKSVNSDFSLSKFESFGNSYLQNIKSEDLSNKIEVGLAMKYKVVNINMENTLFHVKKVSYKDLPGQVL